MTRQNRQQHRAKQIALARGIRTAEQQWAVRDPAIEQPALLQVLDKERQLAEWRHRRRRVPLDVNPTGVGVGDGRPRLNLSSRGNQQVVHNSLKGETPRSGPFPFSLWFSLSSSC